MISISNNDYRIIIRSLNDYARQPYDATDTRAANRRRLAKVVVRKMESKQKQ